MKHKHHALIMAWANGAQIETSCLDLRVWEHVKTPMWSECHEYRVKPVAKPCPDRMEEYLNELLYRAEKHQSQAIAYEQDILLALEPKEET